MAWLLRRGEVLASLDVAHGMLATARGFVGREDEQAALLVESSRAAHSIGVRFPLDVAFLDKDLRVVATRRLPRYRIALPCRGAGAVLQVEAGAFERWRLQPGDALEIRP